MDEQELLQTIKLAGKFLDNVSWESCIDDRIPNDPLDDLKAIETMLRLAFKYARTPTAELFGYLGEAQYRQAMCLEYQQADIQLIKDKLHNSVSNEEKAIQYSKNNQYYFIKALAESMLGDYNIGDQKIYWYRQSIKDSMLNIQYCKEPISYYFCLLGVTQLNLALEEVPDRDELLEKAISSLELPAKNDGDYQDFLFLAEALFQRGIAARDTPKKKDLLQQAHDWYQKTFELYPQERVDQKIEEAKRILSAL